MQFIHSPHLETSRLHTGVSASLPGSTCARTCKGNRREGCSLPRRHRDPASARPRRPLRGGDLAALHTAASPGRAEPVTAEPGARGSLGPCRAVQPAARDGARQAVSFQGRSWGGGPRGGPPVCAGVCPGPQGCDTSWARPQEPVTSEESPPLPVTSCFAACSCQTPGDEVPDTGGAGLFRPLVTERTVKDDRGAGLRSASSVRPPWGQQVTLPWPLDKQGEGRQPGPSTRGPQTHREVRPTGRAGWVEAFGTRAPEIFTEAPSFCPQGSSAIAASENNRGVAWAPGTAPVLRSLTWGPQPLLTHGGPPVCALCDNWVIFEPPNISDGLLGASNCAL